MGVNVIFNIYKRGISSCSYNYSNKLSISKTIFIRP
jgi:hypothetical protein